MLRHSLATMLNAVGTPPKAIQQIIGHADISTTMNRYVHGSEAENRKAMDNVQMIYSSDIAQAVLVFLNTDANLDTATAAITHC